MAQHAQRALAHLFEGVGIGGRARIAHARLHVAPPAVISAPKAHQIIAPVVIASQAHGLHHRFGPGHVERDLLQAGNLAQPPHVVRNDRMIRAQHRAELPHARGAPLDGILVKIVAERVDSVEPDKSISQLPSRSRTSMPFEESRNAPPCKRRMNVVPVDLQIAERRRRNPERVRRDCRERK